MKPENDRRIEQIIRGYAQEEYDEAIADSTVPELYLHLSSLRNGVFGWFPFHGDWRILQIGAGFGSVTGSLLECGASVVAVEVRENRAQLLRKRYECRENLEVVCCDILNYRPAKPFDCIVMENYPCALSKEGTESTHLIAGMLKENGILLIGYHENCGSEGEKEFESVFSSANLTRRKRFHVLPNQLFPQVVATEQSSLKEKIDDRILMFDPWKHTAEPGERSGQHHGKKTVGIQEASFSIDVFSKGELPSSLQTLDMVFLSSDRGRERSRVLRLYADGHAEKSTLYREGTELLLQEHENLQQLQNRGIKTVPQKLIECGITMPRIYSKTLLWQLEKIRKSDILRSVFDRMREDIIKASGGWNEETNLLREGFLDMTPFNVFQIGEDWIYFDQEFKELNCPLGYILFRMLHYSYLHVPKLEELVPLEQMKQRYGLTEHWSDYEAKEWAFLHKIRQIDLYRQIWNWRTV